MQLKSRFLQNNWLEQWGWFSEMFRTTAFGINKWMTWSLNNNQYGRSYPAEKTLPKNIENKNKKEKEMKKKKN